jgi:transposase, IS30 family
VDVAPSTINRELSRNTPRRGRGALIYNACNAQKKTDMRHQLKPKLLRLNDQMKEFARTTLKIEKHSPVLIHVEGKKLLGDFVSHETIYKWIWKSKKSNRRDDKKDKKLYLH